MYLKFPPPLRFLGQYMWVELRRGQEEARRIRQIFNKWQQTWTICCSYMLQIEIGGKFVPSKGFVQFKTFYVDKITVHGCLMGRAYEICRQWVQNRSIAFFYRWQGFFLTFAASAVGLGFKVSIAIHYEIIIAIHFEISIAMHYEIIIAMHYEMIIAIHFEISIAIHCDQYCKTQWD